MPDYYNKCEQGFMSLVRARFKGQVDFNRFPFLRQPVYGFKRSSP